MKNMRDRQPEAWEAKGGREGEEREIYQRYPNQIRYKNKLQFKFVHRKNDLKGASQNDIGMQAQYGYHANEMLLPENDRVSYGSCLVS